MGCLFTSDLFSLLQAEEVFWIQPHVLHFFFSLFFVLEMNQHLDHFIASKALAVFVVDVVLGKFLFLAALSLACNL